MRLVKGSSNLLNTLFNTTLSHYTSLDRKSIIDFMIYKKFKFQKRIVKIQHFYYTGLGSNNRSHE